MFNINNNTYVHTCIQYSVHNNLSSPYIINYIFYTKLFYIHAGLVDVPVRNLTEPAPSRLLRKVDDVFVESLKLRLRQDPSGPGVPPLVVACKDVGKKEVFQHRHKDIYQYEVLGGLHGAKARQALLAEHPEETAYARVYCIAYCGLTDEEALLSIST